MGGMTCATCGATSGEFATATRCMDCQRTIWREKHAARMADPERAEKRRTQLAEYHRIRSEAGLTHPETIRRGSRPEQPGGRLPPDKPKRP